MVCAVDYLSFHTGEVEDQRHQQPRAHLKSQKGPNKKVIILVPLCSSLKFVGGDTECCDKNNEHVEKEVSPCKEGRQGEVAVTNLFRAKGEVGDDWGEEELGVVGNKIGNSWARASSQAHPILGTKTSA